ncbi:MAG: hypothetical protein AAF570_26735 [Bacteroidota bacterium]
MKSNFVFRVFGFSAFRVLPMLVLLLAFSTCKERIEWDGEVASSLDNAFADSEFSMIRNIVDTEARNDTAVYGKTSDIDGVFCPAAVISVIINTPTSARMTIDFGNATNCVDGRQRAGKIIADFNGKWKDAGSTVVISPDGYVSNGYAFDFTMRLTVNGRNADGHLSWVTVVENATMSSLQNGTINWESERVTTWVEGEGDLNPQTNVYEITGTASGTATTGRNFTVNVDEALRIEANCQYVTAGVVSITPQDLTTRTIDYGLETCDNQAVLTVGEFQTNITLP